MPSRLTSRQEADNLSFPLTTYLFAPAHRLLVCAVPKNGCTSIKRWWLETFEPDAPAEPLPDLHAYVRARHSLSLQPDEVINDALASCRKIAFVRDPVERIASAFVEKFVGPADDELFEPAVELLDQLSPDPNRAPLGLTFRDFVAHLDAAPDDHLDVHWRPQSSFLAAAPFDEVLTFAAIGRRLTNLASCIGYGPISPRQANAMEYTDDPPGRWLADTHSRALHELWRRPTAASLVTPDLRQILNARYAEDVGLYQDAVARASQSAVLNDDQGREGRVNPALSWGDPA